MSDIPEWALREACKRLGERYGEFAIGRLSVFVSKAIRVCASLIAEHEEPPVDPLLIEAREIAAQQPGLSAHQQRALRDGEWDGASTVPVALAALRRGMELARETQP